MLEIKIENFFQILKENENNESKLNLITDESDVLEKSCLFRFECNKCKRCFRSLEEFRRHISSHVFNQNEYTLKDEDLSEAIKPQSLVFFDSPYAIINLSGSYYKIFEVITGLDRNIKSDANYTTLNTLSSEFSNLLNSGIVLTLIRNGIASIGVYDFMSNSFIFTKTIKRYTIRKGQGKAQSTHDNNKFGAISAGAIIRRHNEDKMIEEIGKILQHIDKSYSISKFKFIFTLNTQFSNRSLYFNSIFQLKKDDPRIKTYPFTTFNPSEDELKRCQEMLFKIVVWKNPGVS